MRQGQDYYYDTMNVITTKGMGLRHKECDYDQRNVITTKGMCNALFYIIFTLHRKQQHVLLLFCAKTQKIKHKKANKNGVEVGSKR